MTRVAILLVVATIALSGCLNRPRGNETPVQPTATTGTVAQAPAATNVPAPAANTATAVPQARDTAPNRSGDNQRVDIYVHQDGTAASSSSASSAAAAAAAASGQPGTTGQSQYGTQAGQPASSGQQPATAAKTGPQIGDLVDLNPNTDAVLVGTCKGVSNEYGLYIQSGVDQLCTAKLSQVPAGSQLTTDGIQVKVNGVVYKNAILGHVVDGTVDIELLNGGAVLGPPDKANKRFCDISVTADRLNWALPKANRKPLPGWACS